MFKNQALRTVTCFVSVPVCIGGAACFCPFLEIGVGQVDLTCLGWIIKFLEEVDGPGPVVSSQVIFVFRHTAGIFNCSKQLQISLVGRLVSRQVYLVATALTGNDKRIVGCCAKLTFTWAVSLLT